MYILSVILVALLRLELAAAFRSASEGGASHNPVPGNKPVPNVLLFPQAWKSQVKRPSGSDKIDKICPDLYDSIWGVYGIPRGCEGIDFKSPSATQAHVSLNMILLTS